MSNEQKSSIESVTQRKTRTVSRNPLTFFMKSLTVALLGFAVHGKVLSFGRPEQDADNLVAEPALPPTALDPHLPSVTLPLFSPEQAPLFSLSQKLPTMEDVSSGVLLPTTPQLPLSFASGLKKLAASGLNPAIVYAYKLNCIGQPEYPDAVAVARGIITEKIGPQYMKMLNAYLSVQHFIEPMQQRDVLLDAKTLLNLTINANKLFLGGAINASAYRTYTIGIPVQGGNKFRGELLKYFSGEAPWHYKEGGRNEKAQAAFVRRMQDKLAMNAADVSRFIDLVERMYLTSMPIQHQKHPKGTPQERARSKLSKLVIAVEEGQTTPKQNAIIEKVTCITPSKGLSQKMQAWAEETVNAYYACDPTNFEEVCRVMAGIYYRFEKIHPFTDANGRTGMCVVNLLLRVWGYPSILLSHPHELENHNSLYVRKIMTHFSEEGLVEFFRIRIQEAQRASFEDKILQKHVQHLMHLKQWLEEAPEYSSQAIANLGLTFVNVVAPDISTNRVIEKSAAQLTTCYKSTRKVFKRMQTEQNNLRDYFNYKTGISSQSVHAWEVNIHTNSAWLSHLSSAQEAREIADKLKSVCRAKVVSPQKWQLKHWTVRCDDIKKIDMKKLLNELTQLRTASEAEYVSNEEVVFGRTSVSSRHKFGTFFSATHNAPHQESSNQQPEQTADQFDHQVAASFP
jgi:prophage maintenance system killer protein